MNKVVERFQELSFSGDIIPHQWYETPVLRRTNGKANLNAMIILANICYWYRPKTEIDEETNHVIGINQRFEHDKLRMYYQQWADKFGLSKRQVRDAVAFLKKKGLIRVDLRTVTYADGNRVSNVPHIEPIFNAVKAITIANTKDKAPLPRSNGIPPSNKSNRSTDATAGLLLSNVEHKSEITDKTTNKNKNKEEESRSPSGDRPPQDFFKGSAKGETSQTMAAEEGAEGNNRDNPPVFELGPWGPRRRFSYEELDKALRQHQKATFSDITDYRGYNSAAKWGIEQLWDYYRRGVVTLGGCIKLWSDSLKEWEGCLELNIPDRWEPNWGRVATTVKRHSKDFDSDEETAEQWAEQNELHSNEIIEEAAMAESEGGPLTFTVGAGENEEKLFTVHYFPDGDRDRFKAFACKLLDYELETLGISGDDFHRSKTRKGIKQLYLGWEKKKFTPNDLKSLWDQRYQRWLDNGGHITPPNWAYVAEDIDSWLRKPRKTKPRMGRPKTQAEMNAPHPTRPIF